MLKRITLMLRTGKKSKHWIDSDKSNEQILIEYMDEYKDKTKDFYCFGLGQKYTAVKMTDVIKIELI